LAKKNNYNTLFSGESAKKALFPESFLTDKCFIYSLLSIWDALYISIWMLKFRILKIFGPIAVEEALKKLTFLAKKGRISVFSWFAVIWGLWAQRLMTHVWDCVGYRLRSCRKRRDV